ncbi:MAG: membrane protein insertase YidC [Lactobacillus sp.]|nr:membrane protein insertase YidC [Lactobacillus sp.]
MSISAVALLLSGCQQQGSQGGISGFFYKLFGIPLQNIMLHMANSLGKNGAGYAIIIVTLVVRLILMPLMLKQQKGMLEQQHKIQQITPQLKLVQNAMKDSRVTPEKQMKLVNLQSQVYSKNNMKMMGSVGCLPLLIQLPILWAIYGAVANSKALSAATFYGISLGKTSIVLAIIATILTIIQSAISLIGVSEDQKKVMKSTMIIGPVMTIFFSLSFHGAIALYWTAGNLIMVFQQLIVTFIMQPRVKARINQELDEHPITQVVTEEILNQILSDVASDIPKSKSQNSETSLEEELRKKNAGKQKRD